MGHLFLVVFRGQLFRFLIIGKKTALGDDHRRFCFFQYVIGIVGFDLPGPRDGKFLIQGFLEAGRRLLAFGRLRMIKNLGPPDRFCRVAVLMDADSQLRSGLVNDRAAGPHIRLLFVLI